MRTIDTVAAPQLEAPLARAARLFRARDLSGARQICQPFIDAAAAEPADDGARAMGVPAYYWAARCARRDDRPDEALRFLYAGIVAATNVEDARHECLLRSELVHVLSSIGQNDEALVQADAVVQRASQLGDPVGKATAQEALASVYWMTEEWTFALLAYQAAMDLAVACDDLELRVLATLGLAASEEGVARIERGVGQLADADTRLRRSVALLRTAGQHAAALGDDYLLMYSELNCGCSLHTLGALAEARAACERCLANPRHAPVHGHALTTLGRVAFDEGGLREAQAIFERALPLTEGTNKPFAVLLALEALVDVHEALGDTGAALAFMRRYHRLYVTSATEKARVRGQAMAVKYETERARAVAESQRQRAERLELSNADLVSEAAQLSRQTMEDALTGIANRRRFDQALQALVRTESEETTAAEGSGELGGLEPCCVALLDVDHFKQVNDRFSHLVGDEVLRTLGRLFAAGCRRDDLVARYGGEEFVFLSRSLNRTLMAKVCERMRGEVERQDWSALRPGLSVTVSIGIAYHDEPPERGPAALVTLMALADARLYAAKREGRNRVRDSESDHVGSAQIEL